MTVDFYDRKILERVGDIVGKLLKVDIRTASNERGKFARICVQVDINSPLTLSVRIRA